MKFSDIENVIDKHIDEIIAFRRDLHEHPELGGNEVRTSVKVTEQLKKLPVKIRENVGGHGVIADLTGSEEGKTILLRGDMDALPINEINSLSMKDVVDKGNDKILALLKHLVDIALSLNYGSIVVLFDKIDEFSEINADVNKVSEFTLQILTDTNLLYTNKLSIVFSL